MTAIPKKELMARLRADGAERVVNAIFEMLLFLLNLIGAISIFVMLIVVLYATGVSP